MLSGAAASPPVSAAFTVLASWPQPQRPEDIRVEICSLFNRRPTPIDGTLIDLPWAQRLERATKEAAAGSPAKLFNGTKFRLHDVTEERGDGLSTVVVMQLGITDYKTSLGCVEGFDTLAAFAREQQEPTGGRSVDPYLAQALGVESLLLTCDHHAVLFRRSHHVAEMPGWYCCPGGHPEPTHVLSKEASETMTLEEQADWFRRVASPVVVRELLDSAVDEIVAEIGVAREHLHNRGLIGVVLNAATKKPDLVVLVSTTLAAHEVDHIFNKREAEEVFESEAEEGLIAIPFTSTGVQAALLRYKLTPPSAACLTLGLAAATHVAGSE